MLKIGKLINETRKRIVIVTNEDYERINILKCLEQGEPRENFEIWS